MPEYPLINGTNQIIGRVVLNDNKLPEMLMQEIRFNLGGHWRIGDPNDKLFIGFTIIPEIGNPATEAYRAHIMLDEINRQLNGLRKIIMDLSDREVNRG